MGIFDTLLGRKKSELETVQFAQRGKIVRFVDNKDDTITDNKTGLMWQKKDDEKKRSYNEALHYCRELRLAGYSDWRLPTLEELLTIVVQGRPENVDEIFANSKAERYWTITEFEHYVDGKYLGDEIAYTVDFIDGFETTYDKIYEYYVRAVR
ncbi:Uncharacterised protein [uncultured archaeon]|nr:Uncharacterised protein [uncultured archaeon]